MTTGVSIIPEEVERSATHLDAWFGLKGDIAIKGAADRLRALRAELTDSDKRNQQYMRALQILLTDSEGDLDYVKWYITEKVLTIEARNAIYAMEKDNG